MRKVFENVPKIKSVYPNNLFSAKNLKNYENTKKLIIFQKKGKNFKKLQHFFNFLLWKGNEFNPAHKNYKVKALLFFLARKKTNG